MVALQEAFQDKEKRSPTWSRSAAPSCRTRCSRRWGARWAPTPRRSTATAGASTSARSACASSTSAARRSAPAWPPRAQFIFRVVDALRENHRRRPCPRGEPLRGDAERRRLRGGLGNPEGVRHLAREDLRRPPASRLRPRGGLGEIRLPPRQAGSSIMPGKVNPVIPEAVSAGRDARHRPRPGDRNRRARPAAWSSTHSCRWSPHCLLDSFDLLARSCRLLRSAASKGSWPTRRVAGATSRARPRRSPPSSSFSATSGEPRCRTRRESGLASRRSAIARRLPDRRAVRRTDRPGGRLPARVACVRETTDDMTHRASLRLHIGIFGRRNVGKSSLSTRSRDRTWPSCRRSPGTTTDPVEKPMELLPLGPVLFIDTAGIDDVGALGELRMPADAAGARPHRPRRHRDRGGAWGDFEEPLLRRAQRARFPSSSVFNKVRPRAARRPTSLARLSEPSSPAGAHVRRPRGDGLARPPRRRCSPRRPPTSSTPRRSPATSCAPGELAVLVVPDRQGGAEGPPDPAAGADHPRPARRRLVLPGREGTRARGRARSAEPPAEAGRHRLPGVPESRRGHAARRAPDVVLDPLRAVPGRPHRDGARRPGHRAARQRRPRADRRILHPPPDRRGHRARQDPALAHPVRGRQLEFVTVQGHDFPQTSRRTRSSCTAATAWATGARCCRGSCAAARPACRSPTTA